MRSPFPSQGSGGLVGLALSLVTTLGVFCLWHTTLPPIQSFYLEAYLKAEYTPHGNKPDPKTFTILTVSGKDATLANSPGELGGAAVRSVSITAPQFATWLRLAIFNGKSGFQIVAVPVTISAFFLILSMAAGSTLSDRQKAKALKGIRLRGVELVSPQRFNRTIKGGGIPFLLENKPSRIEQLKKEAVQLRISRDYENSHILTMGDPGSGKTSIMFQVLDEVANRGNETAIVYDPHLEFTSRYFKAERGDIILNPLDARCPAWSPSAELNLSDSAVAEAEALQQGASLFPGQEGERDWFFVHTCQLVWKYLTVTHQPTAHQMANLLEHCTPLIDDLIKGTAAQHMLPVNAPQHHAAVVGHLVKVAYSLRQLPEVSDSKKLFVIKNWCQSRKGWIFLTNTQKTRKSLKPIQSLWLDALITELLSQGERSDLPPVWISLDELQTLQKLPTLVELVTEGRKSVRALLGFQGKDQIADIFGGVSKTVLSAPKTKFFLSTTEEAASTWIVNTIGKVELQRVRESKSSRGEISYSTEVVKENLLLESEISGLPDREGYLKHQNFAVKVKVPYMKRVALAPAFIPREGVPVVKKPLPELVTTIGSEPESKEENASEYMAPPFLILANTSTVHNQKSAWPQPPQPKSKMPTKTTARDGRAPKESVGIQE